jgi:hypothetical protein
VWRLEDLREEPVLLVIADRRAAEDADAWGRRLAAAAPPVARWIVAGRAAWVTVADLRGVPEFARDDARARLRERERRQGDDERRLRSPLLLDWEGRLASAVGAARREASVVVLSREHREVGRERGAPTDDGVRRVVEALKAATAR